MATAIISRHELLCKWVWGECNSFRWIQIDIDYLFFFGAARNPSEAFHILLGMHIAWKTELKSFGVPADPPPAQTTKLAQK